MSRPKIKIDVLTKAKAEEELAKIKDGKLSIQLKSIIAAAEHPVEKVAKIMKYSMRSIFRWVNNFQLKGTDGLRDKPKGHMKSKIEDVHKKEIEKWILNSTNVRGERVLWTLKKLQKELYEQFGIQIGTTPLWKHLKKMGMVFKSPRPVHAKADPSSHDEFKKKSK